MGYACLLIAFFFLSLVAPARLFAVTAVNEGETTVKMNVRSRQGIVGGASIKPGQTVNLKSDLVWIEHVPEGRSEQVRVKIIENDGKEGLIAVPGGRYTLSSVTAPEPEVKAEPKAPRILADGFAENSGNIAMLLSLITKDNRQSYLLLLPGQRVVIPRETAEVIADQHGWSSADPKVALAIMMPDGKEHMIRELHAVVRVSPEAGS